VTAVGKRSSHAERRQFQKVLRELRIERGLSQSDVARALKRPQSFVSKYEAGERRLDVLELREVCVALGVSLALFVRRLERVLR